MKYTLDNIVRDPAHVPNYTFTFKFEDEFDPKDAVQFMLDNWTKGFFFCGLYLIVIFSGVRYMQDRPAYKLRGPLIAWNTALALFSIVGALRTAPELFHVLNNYGFYHSVCVPSFMSDGVSTCWIFLISLSKVVEFGDTVFIVLRKQQLIFLHWYHHMTVLMYCWISISEFTSSSRWFVVMNYSVHSLMYSYYALRAMGHTLPRKVAMSITICQLMQMFMGITVNVYALHVLREDQLDCHISWMNLKLSLTMYFSYFVLFAWFFYKAYFRSSRKANENNNRFKNLPQVNRADGKFKSN